jgi:hypothetical protein
VRDNHVMADDWQRAAEIEWEDFFRAVEGRELRPLFVEAIPYLPTATAAEPPLIAVDLGCGDGAETLELLRRGWRCSRSTARAPGSRACGIRCHLQISRD